jgi:hypothetical protein
VRSRRLLRLWAVAFLFVSLIAGPALAQADQTVFANQRAFEEGTKAMMEGDYLSATAIFESLAEATDAPRVRLELARVLFLAGQYRRSRGQFLKVYQSKDLPYPVRRAINLYLDEIDDRIGFVRPQLSVAFDSNPTRTAKDGVYDVLGVPLEFDQSGRKRAVGVSYRLDAVQPITTGSPWAFVGEIGGTSYDVGEANYSAGSAALRHADFRRRANVQGGIRAARSSSLERSGPFLSYSRRLAHRADRQTNVDLSFEWQNYAHVADLDQAVFSGSARHARDLGGRWTGSVAGGVSLSTGDNSVLPNQLGWANAGLTVGLPKLNKNVSVSVTEAFTNFGQTDLFFGERRRDGLTQLDLGIYAGSPRFGLFPGVVLSYSHRNSNIDFYRYDQAGAAMELRRRF